MIMNMDMHIKYIWVYNMNMDMHSYYTTTTSPLLSLYLCTYAHLSTWIRWGILTGMFSFFILTICFYSFRPAGRQGCWIVLFHNPKKKGNLLLLEQHMNTKVNTTDIQKILSTCHSQIRSLPHTNSNLEQAQYHIFQAIYALSHYRHTSPQLNNSSY